MAAGYGSSLVKTCGGGYGFSSVGHAVIPGAVGRGFVHWGMRVLARGGTPAMRHIGTEVSAYSPRRRCARRHVVVSKLVPACLISMVVFVEGRGDDATEPDADVGNIRFVFLARKKQPA